LTAAWASHAWLMVSVLSATLLLLNPVIQLIVLRILR
jgi:hypothetical protein